VSFELSLRRFCVGGGVEENNYSRFGSRQWPCMRALRISKTTLNEWTRATPYRNGASDYGIEMGRAVRICLWIERTANVTSAYSSAYGYAYSGYEWTQQG